MEETQFDERNGRIMNPSPRTIMCQYTWMSPRSM